MILQGNDLSSLQDCSEIIYDAFEGDWTSPEFS